MLWIFILKGALYWSPHEDENDVQTIAHKCQVMSYKDYEEYRTRHPLPKSSDDHDNVYYVAGLYDPINDHIDTLPYVKLKWSEGKGAKQAK